MKSFQNRPLALCGCLFAILSAVGIRLSASQKSILFLAAAVAFLAVMTAQFSYQEMIGAYILSGIF